MGIMTWIEDFTRSTEFTQALCNKLALDATSSSIILTNAEGNIVYANGSMKQLINQNEHVFTTAFPSISVRNIEGMDVELFFKHSPLLCKTFNDLTSKTSSEMKIGPLTFELTFTPFFDESNNQIGTMIEWVDLSKKLIKDTMLNALDKAQAVIEFTPEGIIVAANDNFLNAKYVNTSTHDPD